jgi:hypothetical protein
MHLPNLYQHRLEILRKGVGKRNINRAVWPQSNHFLPTAEFPLTLHTLKNKKSSSHLSIKPAEIFCHLPICISTRPTLSSSRPFLPTAWPAPSPSPSPPEMAVRSSIFLLSQTTSVAMETPIAAIRPAVPKPARRALPNANQVKPSSAVAVDW